MTRPQRSCWALFLLALALACGNGLQAQQAAKGQTKHCLWKVEGKTNALYLFGSIHFLKKDFYPLAKPIEEAYQRSDTVVFEVDFEEMSSPQSQLKMAREARYGEGDSLRQHVSKETYARLQSYLAESGAPAAAFESLKPWMVAVALLGAELQKLGFNPEQGVDKYFFDKARKDKKAVAPLETLDFQLGFFNGLSKKEEDAMLSETLQEIGKFKTILGDVVEAWKTGDTKKLDKFILESMRGFPDIHKKLLIDRNKQWVTKLEKMVREGKNVFVVVGAAHLIGKDSVVDLLQQKGFKVNQL